MQRPYEAHEDHRLATALNWLTESGYPIEGWAVVSIDASFRRYFRVWQADTPHVLMDAPPHQEDCAPFVHVAALLREAGVHAPRVLAADLERGFLLLDDLGERTYLEGLTPAEGEALFAPAIDALLAWQRASAPAVLPEYDEALLRRELRLFPEWYLMRHLGWSSEAAWSPAWRSLEDALVERALAQGQVFVHRDYMPRNLMRSRPLPGVIDFQDAVYGPVTYDIACLLRDAFIDWPTAFEEQCFTRYWQGARASRLPVADDYARFRRDLDAMAAQRHLKVLGIFARLNYRDGKPRYLAEAPRFIGYLRREIHGDEGLLGIQRLLDQLGGGP